MSRIGETYAAAVEAATAAQHETVRESVHRTFYYLVAVAVDDDGTIVTAHVEAETALRNPSEPVYVEVSENVGEWRAVREEEGHLDRETLVAINAALLAGLGPLQADYEED